jgi:hypothetical protein
LRLFPFLPSQRSRARAYAAAAAASIISGSAIVFFFRCLPICVQ